MPRLPRRLKKGLIRLIALLLLAYVLMLAGWVIGKYLDIRSGEVTYTEGIGWIDWGHGRMEGPVVLLESLSNAVDNQPLDTIRYGQQMYYLGVKARLQKEFVMQHLDSTCLVSTGWEIYRRVSDGFETMQGGFPFSVMPFIHRSSFEPEDYNGNRLAFYCAANHLNTNDLKAALPALSTDDAVAKYYTGRWNTTGRPDSMQAALIYQIDAYFHRLKKETPCQVSEINTSKILKNKYLEINL